MSQPVCPTLTKPNPMTIEDSETPPVLTVQDNFNRLEK